MLPVKICGITNIRDALAAAQCGAAAVGFIFYPSSPRFIKPQDAKNIIKALPKGLVTVGVFVNESTETIIKISDELLLDMIQLHGDESPEDCRKLGATRVIKALHLKNEVDVAGASAYDVAAILVDSRRGNLYGGTGKTTDWALARKIKDKKPLILSGGLTPENIREALLAVEPDALDVNSGVESAPGKKDHEKLLRLFETLRADHHESQPSKMIFSKRMI